MPSNDRTHLTGDPAVDRAVQLLRSDSERQPAQVTTGAGIAIASAWLAGSAVTIAILLIAFVFNPMTEVDQDKINGFGLIIFIFLIASPMIAAYSITKLILSKD